VKKLLGRFLLLVLFVLVAVFVLYYFFIPEPVLSEAQEETIWLFGYPYQFEITYLPAGSDEEPTLVRKEIWYYPLQEIKITFMGGDVFSTGDLLQEEIDVSQTNLHPEDFHFDQSFSDIEALLGSQNIEKVDFVPGFYEDGVLETYLSDKALFIIEYDKLSYFQTLGLYVGEETQVFEEEDDTAIWDEMAEEIDVTEAILDEEISEEDPSDLYEEEQDVEVAEDELLLEEIPDVIKSTVPTEFLHDEEGDTE
jgi:hypothetical protein